MKYYITITIFIIIYHVNFGQDMYSPCSHAAIVSRQLETNVNASDELLDTEIQLQRLIKDIRSRNQSVQPNTSQYVIPVVMHVFHDGNFGKMDMEQALSGLKILNDDFNGLNDGWETIDSEFDTIKGSLDITFCLATIDPDGNPTTGLIYHEDENAVFNQGDLFQYAWDNYKYLNIYFPKYAFGSPSNFTAYAFYPSTTEANNNTGGIFYSSIRWGYGNDSELAEGDDWASVCSHEAGHWLNLRHTFEGGCGNGDFVDDTPPTLGGGIELAGCYNNDNSCGVGTNGENFMDYNHRCKKMFTQGQIHRMEAALYLPSRINLWSEQNLIETGCSNMISSVSEIDLTDGISIFPNPASNIITIRNSQADYWLEIFTVDGRLVNRYFTQEAEIRIDVSNFNNGIYFVRTNDSSKIQTEKFVIDK